MKQIAKTPEAKLKFHLEQMTACENSFVEHAVLAGEVLKQKKASCDHGEWLDWLEENWTRTKRTAQDYMALAELPPVKVLACKSIREAKKLIPAKTKRASHLETPLNVQRAGHLEPQEPQEPAENPVETEGIPESSQESPEMLAAHQTCDWIVNQEDRLPWYVPITKAIQANKDDQTACEELRDLLLALYPVKTIKRRATKADVGQVWERWEHYHPQAKLSEKREKLIRARLKDGYGVDDLRQAIDGIHRSPFHNGENDRGGTYLRLGLALDPDKIDGFIEMATADLTVISENTRRTARAFENSDFGHLLEAD